jgi:opacity protein-like surface antigen
MLKFFSIPYRVFLTFFLACSLFSSAQEMKVKKNFGGVLSVGGRSTISTFNDGKWGDIGTGSGGQFMVQLSNRVNTAWFFDYITGTVGDFANRTDYHIGWSVMYYLIPNTSVTEGNTFVTKTPKIQPYILAGHCFDYSNIKDNTNNANFAERWSSAVQAGLGTHFNLTNRLDVNVQGQYMIHLGNDIDAEKENNAVVFHKNSGVNLQGHILITVGVNFKIADLW